MLLDQGETHDNSENMLFRFIGARMISIFNDAKRVTLSAWSWPSRIIASIMAHNFEVSGNSTLNSADEFNFHYLTPHYHGIFLDCIVQSDLDKVRLCLSQALAVSLRLDASVDRTLNHYVYVMAHIIKQDATTSTLFIGFSEPKTGGADAYVQCLKDVVKQILPWDTVFKVVTSIVTDGEPLNTGRLNGLVARLVDERLCLARLFPPQLPLFSIWCVPHRINLAWKSVCRIHIIARTIRCCTALSTYFRKSAKRTRNLRNAAAENNFNPTLRFPAFFKIRWTEHLFNLLNAVLRNWRAMIKYFESKDLKSRLQTWLSYDRLHFITFLVDILSLIKKFQKSCQSDCISIVDVLPLRGNLIDNLKRCENETLEDGW